MAVTYDEAGNAAVGDAGTSPTDIGGLYSQYGQNAANFQPMWSKTGLSQSDLFSGANDYFSKVTNPEGNSAWWGPQAWGRIPLQGYALSHPDFNLSKYTNPGVEQQQQANLGNTLMDQQKQQGAGNLGAGGVMSLLAAAAAAYFTGGASLGLEGALVGGAEGALGAAGGASFAGEGAGFLSSLAEPAAAGGLIGGASSSFDVPGGFDGGGDTGFVGGGEGGEGAVGGGSLSGPGSGQTGMNVGPWYDQLPQSVKGMIGGGDFMSNPLSSMRSLFSGSSNNGGTGSMPWGSLGNLTSMGSGIVGLLQQQKQRKLAEQLAAMSDPNKARREALLNDPSSITSVPGYQSGLQAVQRAGAAQGWTGSGNMMNALANYGGNFYNQYLGNLAGNPVASAGVRMQGESSANDLLSRSLASLGYGVARL